MSDYAKEIEMALNRDLKTAFPNANLAHKTYGLNGDAVPPLQQLENIRAYTAETAAKLAELEAHITGDPVNHVHQPAEHPEGFIPQIINLTSQIGAELTAISQAIDRIKARL